MISRFARVCFISLLIALIVCAAPALSEEAQAPHTHVIQYMTTQEPTCTQPGVRIRGCIECDWRASTQIEIKALGHLESVETIEPTCTDKGSTTTTCTRCGEVIDEQYTDALEHDLSSTVIDPACTEPGSKTTVCSRCDYLQTDTLDALGHELSYDTVKATCTKAGSETATCARCDFTETKTTEVIAHEDGAPLIKEASMFSEGSREIRCKNCSALLRTEVIPAEGIPVWMYVVLGAMIIAAGVLIWNKSSKKSAGKA